MPCARSVVSQNETPPAIGAINIAILADMEEDARMAVHAAAAVTGKFLGVDLESFGRIHDQHKMRHRRRPGAAHDSGRAGGCNRRQRTRLPGVAMAAAAALEIGTRAQTPNG